jgi:biopolymer transport protein TolQ
MKNLKCEDNRVQHGVSRYFVLTGHPTSLLPPVSAGDNPGLTLNVPAEKQIIKGQKMLSNISFMAVPMAVTTSDLGTGLRGELWDLAIHAGPVVKLVLLLLLGLSVCCWGIMFFKFRSIRSATKESENFLTIFWESTRLSQSYKTAQTLHQSPLAEIFRSGYLELQNCTRPTERSSIQNSVDTDISDVDISRNHKFSIGTIKRALDQASISEISRLEKNLGFLATTGSTAPFIGLFGTVWGIMDAFRQIGIRGSASLATVAPGISEALIATAFGLLAAIPAVVAYNYFLGKIRILNSEMDNFSSEFLNIVERHFENIGRQQK